MGDGSRFPCAALMSDLGLRRDRTETGSETFAIVTGHSRELPIL